jgi:hypothetical protein
MRRRSSQIPRINIWAATKRRGREADGFGETKRVGRRKPRKNAPPPKDGVARLCHRFPVGRATQLNHTARWRIGGTRSTVSKKDEEGRRKRQSPSAI